MGSQNSSQVRPDAVIIEKLSKLMNILVSESREV
jgi:hypothetical protein